MYRYKVQRLSQSIKKLNYYITEREKSKEFITRKTNLLTVLANETLLSVATLTERSIAPCKPVMGACTGRL